MNGQNIAKEEQDRELGGYPMVSEQIRALTPIQAIRAKCLDCSCGSCREVRLCETKGCDLWPYRMGKRPKRGFIAEGGTDSENSKYHQ